MHLAHRKALLDFDGTDVQPLRVLAAKTQPSPAAFRHFLQLAKDRDSRVQIGATWIIKNLAERYEKPLLSSISTTLVARIGSVEDSLSRLQLLQTLPMCHLGPATVVRLRHTLEQLVLTEQHGLTRAWVFNGFAEVARHDPSYRDQATALLSEAYQMERAAVRARIRNALDAL